MKTIFCSLLAVFLCLIYSTTGREFCDVGSCIKPQDCTALYKFGDSYKKTNGNTKLFRQFLNNMNCNRGKSLKRFCCPKTLNTDAFNVLRHKNYPLLVHNSTACGALFEDFILKPNYGSSEHGDQWKAVIFKSASDATSAFCAGTVINYRYILTTASCVAKYKNEPEELTVRTGDQTSLFANEGCHKNCNRCSEMCSKNTKVAEIEIHPKYKKFHNIALLRLKEPLVFDGYTTPVCLPLYPEEKSAFEVYGWGISRTNAPVYKSLQRMETVVKETFGGKIKKEQILGKLTIITPKQQIPNCIEDDGAALIGESSSTWNQQTLYGIHVFSTGGCKRGLEHHTIYENIYPHVQWILDTIRA